MGAVTWTADCPVRQPIAFTAKAVLADQSHLRADAPAEWQCGRCEERDARCGVSGIADILGQRW